MNTSTQDQPIIRLALPSKGHLAEGALELLHSAGYRVRRPSDRQYEATIAGQPRFHVVFMRPADIVAQVDEGRCALGVTGGDVYAEHSAEIPNAIPVLPDLGYAGCRLVVAVPESWIDVTHPLDLVELTTEFQAEGKAFRVSTKYPRLVREQFRKWGIYHYQLVESDGALELHPSLGIADIIVDLTSSGSTLKENRLRELCGGTVLESSACLIGHCATLRRLLEEGPRGPLGQFLDALDAVRAAEGWTHLEVVGQGPSGEACVRLLADRGAVDACWASVKQPSGEPAWRATAVLRDRDLVPLQRDLFALGVLRLVGTEPRWLVRGDQESTWDRLQTALAADRVSLQ
jgi:ATP phosphoribosyltransferase